MSVALWCLAGLCLFSGGSLVLGVLIGSFIHAGSGEA